MWMGLADGFWVGGVDKPRILSCFWVHLLCYDAQHRRLSLSVMAACSNDSAICVHDI